MTEVPGGPGRLRVAAVGDLHGRFGAMCDGLSEWERANGKRIDLVLQVGDLEPVRHAQDLESIPIPPEFRRVGDFPDFWRGERRFPWPVLFIAGNHEPFAWLEQHRDGFELLPHLRYLGRAGVTEVAGLTIAGLSGIFSPARYVGASSRKASPGWDHAAYFTRTDVDQLARTRSVDVLLLHDWPAGVLSLADLEGRTPEESNLLLSAGSIPAAKVAEQLRPRYIFCGHLHRAFHGRLPLGDDEDAEVFCLANVGSSDTWFVVREIEVASTLGELGNGELSESGLFTFSQEFRRRSEAPRTGGATVGSSSESEPSS